MIYIASDHAGFKLKSELIEYLSNKGIEVEDVGAYSFNKDDDYPDFIKPLAEKVLGKANNMGIIICKNGIGVSIAANRFKGIRAGLSFTPDHAKSGRVDDNTNVLALPADYIDTETAIKIVKIWLNTEFSFESRHIRRLQKLDKLVS